MRARVALIATGALLGIFGVFRILTQVPGTDILTLLLWLIAAVVLHDAILSPLIAGAGAGLAKLVPPRARRFLAPALVTGGLIAVIALPLIYRENSQPVSKAILQQNYAGNLAVLLGVVTAVMLLAYLTTLVLERRGHPNTATASPRLDEQDPPKN